LSQSPLLANSEVIFKAPFFIVWGEMVVHWRVFFFSGFLYNKKIRKDED